MKTTSFICLFLCIFLFQQIHAQQPVSVSVLRLVAPFKDSVHLRGYASCFVDSTSLMSLQSIQNQNFTPLSILTFAPKVGYSRYTYWLRFDLENLSQTDTLKRSFNLDVRLDSLTVFVTEHGLMKDSIRIGMFIRPHPQREKVDYPSNRTALIKLPPLAHFTVFAKIKSLHFDQDLDPVLFRTDKEANYFIWKWIPIYTWELCFLGILTFMALLTFGSYFQYRHRAYLFYGLYIVAHLIAYLCDFEHYEQFQLRLPVAWLNIYYRVPVYFSANIFYLLFTASFLESRRDYPQLHRFTQIFLALYLSFMVIERGLIFYDYIMATEITNFFAIFNGFVALIFLFYVMWIFRNKSLAYYLLAGSLCYVFGIIAAQLSISTNTMWNNGSLWNQLGILAELIFFWLGLAYKFRLDAIDKERADMVVMGTHGRTGLNHWLLGSVAERVVRTARVPVMTVRAP